MSNPNDHTNEVNGSATDSVAVKARTAGKKKAKTVAVIATDSEWDERLEKPWISTAFAHEGKLLVYMRDDIEESIKKRLRAVCLPGEQIIFIKRNNYDDLLKDARRRWNIWGVKTLLYHFYSPKDVEYAVGWPQFRAAIDKGQVRQRRNLAGRVGASVFIKDMSGWAGKQGFESFASGLGVEMPSKGFMDEYKKRMWDGLHEHPEEFLRYAFDDVGKLLECQKEFLAMFAKLTDALGMPGRTWTAENIPMTLGALVAKTFERWLHVQAGDLEDAFKFCLRKLGILDRYKRHYKKSREVFWEVTRAIKTVADLEARRQSEAVRRFFGEEGPAVRFRHTALDSCGVCSWADRKSDDSAIYNALVQGGRCINERPDEYRIGPGLDVDIDGCYGTTLRSSVYPLGVPTSWSFLPNDVPLTLGEWLDRYEDDLVDDRWSVVVSGKLSFEQDLLLSKIVNVSDIRKVLDDEGAGITAPTALLRREVVNAIITADKLRVLKAVSTEKEWAEWRRLEVTTGAAYLKSNRVDTLEGWCERVLAAENIYQTDKSGKPEDLRPRWWVEVPLEGFVGRLADERQRVKKLLAASMTEEEKSSLEALDSVLKVVINTVYGVSASRYFAMGNTVLANNITARARVGVWMLAKALGLRQSITDGGIYTPEAVPAFKRKRPGFATLSRPWEWQDRDGRRFYVPLGGLDWSGPLEWNKRDLDGLAMAHVREFWSPYGLEFPFKLRHKTENTFWAAAYLNKGDYALRTIERGYVFKLRGKERGLKESADLPHPHFALFRAILDGSDEFPADLRYTRGGILRVGTYRKAQDSKSGYQRLKGLRPGDDIPPSTHRARYNNLHMPILDHLDYLNRLKRKKVRSGQLIEWFERYRREGILAVHKAMLNNKLGKPKGD
jgi:hypothetical protein